MVKKKFSKHWKESKQPRKQRKYRYNAPLHIKQKMISAHLSLDLRKKYGKRSIGVRKGDKVKIMSGQFKGKIGKITDVNLKNLKLKIEGVQLIKKDGSKVDYPIDPSNVQILELNLDDKKRQKTLARK